MNIVHQSVSRITGKEPTSLGLHPVVYFYTSGGSFTPWSFLAWADILNTLFEAGQVNAFCAVRSNLEEFLISDKWAMSEIVHKNGSGHRSVPWLERYWTFVLERFVSGRTAAEVSKDIKDSRDFGFLALKTPVLRLSGENNDASFSRSTKTAAIWKSALPGAPKCNICNGLWHRNSIHFDHTTEKSAGGSGTPDNIGVTHPYCDSTYKYTQGRIIQAFLTADKTA